MTELVIEKQTDSYGKVLYYYVVEVGKKCHGVYYTLTDAESAFELVKHMILLGNKGVEIIRREMIEEGKINE